MSLAYFRTHRLLRCVARHNRTTDWMYRYTQGDRTPRVLRAMALSNALDRTYRVHLRRVGAAE